MLGKISSTKFTVRNTLMAVAVLYVTFQTLMSVKPFLDLYRRKTLEYNQALGVVETCLHPSHRRNMADFCSNREEYVQTWPLTRTFYEISERISFVNFLLYSVMETWLGVIVLIILVWVTVARVHHVLTHPRRYQQTLVQSGQQWLERIAPNPESHSYNNYASASTSTSQRLPTYVSVTDAF